MSVKIDTKEKFTVITPQESNFSVNMTEELVQMLSGYIQKQIPHIVLNLQNVSNIDNESAEKIAQLQQNFYEYNCSFVICELQEPVETLLENLEILEVLNVTPTESEAWDIVQMEEIERELLGGEE